MLVRNLLKKWKKIFIAIKRENMIKSDEEAGYYSLNLERK